MDDRPQWHPEALLGGLGLMAGLMALAGVVDALDWYAVQLNFFGYVVESPRAHAIWIAGCLTVSVFAWYALYVRLRDR